MRWTTAALGALLLTGACGDPSSRSEPGTVTGALTDAAADCAPASDAQADVDAGVTDSTTPYAPDSEAPPPDPPTAPACPACDQCPNPTLLPSVKQDLSGEKEFTMDCILPGMDGKLGASFKVGATVSASPPTCTAKNSTAECKGSASAGIAAEASLHLCNDTYQVKASGGVDVSSKYCTTCEPECQWKCHPDQECRTVTAHLEGSAAQQRFFGMQEAWKKSALGVSGAIKCGATLGVEAGLGLELSGTQNLGYCGACADCVSYGVTPSLTATADVKCEVGLKVGKLSLETGCENCGKASIGLTASAKVYRGACDQQTCLEFKSKVALATPKIERCFGLLWYHVDVEAGMDAWFSAAADSCGGIVTDKSKKPLFFEVKDDWGGCAK
ncbi:MAG: hypothetical protein HYZ29_26750 [Myxococcales bacterium]|nr:hypothetical protein [Myxococcales bacterium]